MPAAHTSSSILRVAIAGCGRVAGAPDEGGKVLATNHAIAARECSNVALVAASDRDASRTKRFCDYWGIPAAYQDVALMCRDARVDLLVVATPPETHEAVCLQGLAAGVRGLLCEKPFTGTHDGALRILNAAKAARVPVVANFMRRWDSSHQAVAARIAGGELGELRAVQAVYTGTLRGNGAHLFDTLGMMVDAALPPASKWSVLARTNPTSTWVDPPLSVTMLRDGCVAQAIALAGAAYFAYEMQLFGTKGRVRLLRSGNDIRFDWPARNDSYPDHLHLERVERLPRDTLPQSFSRALAGLRDAVLANDATSKIAHEHVRTLALIDELATPPR